MPYLRLGMIPIGNDEYVFLLVLRSKNTIVTVTGAAVRED
jgi:hypothetical protein